MAPAGGRLVVITGLAGAGKTTLARVMAERIAAVRLSPDEWMIALGVSPFDGEFRHRLELRMVLLAGEILRQNGRVIVEFGSWSRQERDVLRAAGRAAGAQVQLVVVDPGHDEVWRRLSARNAVPGEVVLSREEFERSLEWWEPPDDDELALWDIGERT